jgi:predicted Zn-dependent protease
MSYGEYGYSRGHRIPLQMILAVVIAAIGIIGYLARTEVNPVTGKRQHIALSVDEEKALGLEAVPEMTSKMGGDVPPDDSRARIVEYVGRRLVRDSDAGRSPYADNFHFFLLKDPQTVNAFALPGGQIFITRGLMQKLGDEAELAGVLGHEIGHVINRHTAQQMAKGQLGQTLAAAVSVGATDNRGGGRNAALAAMMVNQMFQLRYSRNDESEADTFGLKYMAQAGYDPRAMLDVMRVLKEASRGQRQPEFLATHPLPETRLDDIQNELTRDYPNGVPSALTRGRSLEGFGGRTAETGSADPQKSLGPWPTRRRLTAGR